MKAAEISQPNKPRTSFWFKYALSASSAAVAETGKGFLFHLHYDPILVVWPVWFQNTDHPNSMFTIEPFPRVTAGTCHLHDKCTGASRMYLPNDSLNFLFCQWEKDVIYSYQQFKRFYLVAISRLHEVLDRLSLTWTSRKHQMGSCFNMLQCLKLMVAQSPLTTKNWAGPVKFDPGQVKIIIDYIRREIFLTFLGD